MFHKSHGSSAAFDLSFLAELIGMPDVKILLIFSLALIATSSAFEEGSEKFFVRRPHENVKVEWKADEDPIVNDEQEINFERKKFDKALKLIESLVGDLGPKFVAKLLDHGTTWISRRPERRILERLAEKAIAADTNFEFRMEFEALASRVMSADSELHRSLGLTVLAFLHSLDKHEMAGVQKAIGTVIAAVSNDFNDLKFVSVTDFMDFVLRGLMDKDNMKRVINAFGNDKMAVVKWIREAEIVETLKMMPDKLSVPILTAVGQHFKAFLSQTDLDRVRKVVKALDAGSIESALLKAMNN